jgi:methylphosphotriester-DNA--protein-cysteine methyltransferase
MIQHAYITDKELYGMLRRKAILFGGNSKLKIYGRLTCASGKRMKPANRVFFTSEKEAANNGYRPCGHCMRSEYRQWKHARSLHD